MSTESTQSAASTEASADVSGLASSREQIGTVRVVRLRVYPLHPDGDVEDITQPSVVVPPGIYPVYRATNSYGVGVAYWWEMTGQHNEPGVENMGGGLLVAHLSDIPVTSERNKETVTVTSARLTAAAFAPLVADQDPTSPLRFTLEPGTEPQTERTWRVAICVDVTAPDPDEAARQVWEGVANDLPPVVTVFPIDGASPDPAREAVTVDLSDPEHGFCPLQSLHDELFDGDPTG